MIKTGLFSSRSFSGGFLGLPLDNPDLRFLFDPLAFDIEDWLSSDSSDASVGDLLAFLLSLL